MWQDVLGLVPIVIMILLFILFIFQYYEYYGSYIIEIQKEDLAISKANYFIMTHENFEFDYNSFSIGNRTSKFVSFPVLHKNKIVEVISYA